MPSFFNTRIWKQTLSTRNDDLYPRQRDRLRVAFESSRSRAKPLAEAIARDLPDMTVHDVNHLDALWEYADLIAGPKTILNPCEGFVLGCAFLIHDLGMGLSAYPEGLTGLKKLTIWRDVIADLLQRVGITEINDDAIESAPADLQRLAVAEVLRRLHAQRADSLAVINFASPSNKNNFYLIEDSELRDAFGPIIGRIASSHWWGVDQLGSQFHTIMGAQVGFPQNWTVDPLRLACILRCADYAHIDERRAPGFVFALRKPRRSSEDYWKFQSKLYRPRLESDRLVYTAKSPFSIEEANAWWLCFDTLAAIDSELKKVDSLLADTHRIRFAARGVKQANDASRLATLIQTEGWKPVDTRIRVSAVADLVGKLGGEDLYGDSAIPPLRELIQNAADAVRARRLLDHLNADWGEIRVTTGKDDSGSWLQVEDTGVGMSETVLTGPLLDFGTPFWDSPLMHDQFPGLAAKGFKATGTYGIGFFSVFMWGERVRIISQRYDKGRDDTLVLSFEKGLKDRPLLRHPHPNEHIPGGGTSVKVWFSDDDTLNRLYQKYTDGHKIKLAQVCALVAPCLDVSLKVGSEGNLETVIAANDWLSISDEALLERISPFDLIDDYRSSVKLAPTLQLLKTERGVILGRAAIWKGPLNMFFARGVVTSGGLLAGILRGVLGVISGHSRRASRDLALPSLSNSMLSEWASRECNARLQEGHSKGVLYRCAQVINALGVEPAGLPIAKTDSGWVTSKEIECIAKSIDMALIVQDIAVDQLGGVVTSVNLNKGVFAVDLLTMTIIDFDPPMKLPLWPPINDEQDWTGHGKGFSRTLLGAVVRSLARGWECSVSEVLKVSDLWPDQMCIGILAEEPCIFDAVRVIRRPPQILTAIRSE